MGQDGLDDIFSLSSSEGNGLVERIKHQKSWLLYCVTRAPDNQCAWHAPSELRVEFAAMVHLWAGG